MPSSSIFKHIPVKKDDRVQRLILSPGAHVTVYGQMRQEGLHLRRGHRFGFCVLLLAFCSHGYEERWASHADGRATGRPRDALCPSVSFRDAQGAEHIVYSSTASYPPKHQVGDTVRVLYSPEHPRDAKIESFFSLWGLPFVTGLLAAFYLPLGLLVWFWPRIVARFRPRPPIIHAA